MYIKQQYFNKWMNRRRDEERKEDQLILCLNFMLTNYMSVGRALHKRSCRSYILFREKSTIQNLAPLRFCSIAWSDTCAHHAEFTFSCRNLHNPPRRWLLLTAACCSKRTHQSALFLHLLPRRSHSVHHHDLSLGSFAVQNCGNLEQRAE